MFSPKNSNLKPTGINPQIDPKNDEVKSISFNTSLITPSNATQYFSICELRLQTRSFINEGLSEQHPLQSDFGNCSTETNFSDCSSEYNPDINDYLESDFKYVEKLDANPGYKAMIVFIREHDAAIKLIEKIWNLLAIILPMMSDPNMKNKKTQISKVLLLFIQGMYTKSTTLLLLDNKYCLDLVNSFTPDEDNHPLQSLEDWEWGVDSIQDFIDKFGDVKKSKIYKKFYKLMMYALSFKIFEKCGVKIDELSFGLLQEDALKQKLHLGPDFVVTIVDTITFLCKKGFQILKYRSIDCIFHSSKDYNNFQMEVSLLKRQYSLLTNPEAHNFNEFDYRRRLDDAIEKGQSIVKFNNSADQFSYRMMVSYLNDLLTLKSDLCTKSAARETREPPFSLLLCGDSGIAKSTITELLFTHFGKINKLNTDKTYCYTRNPVAKFWDGFTTSQWAVILDDVAFMHPNKAPNGDPSVMEFLQIINAVPFTPDQADLSDKGRTPLRAKLCIATSNTQDLNAHYYFSCPSAAQRRFPFIIEPTVKVEFRIPGTMMLDSARCTLHEGYPDYWTWTIKKVTPVSVTAIDRKAKIDIVHSDVDLKTFLKWYNGAIKQFNENMVKVKESISVLSKTHICDECSLPDSMCECLSLQADWSSATMLETLFVFLCSMLHKLTPEFLLVQFYTYLYSYLSYRYQKRIRSFTLQKLGEKAESCLKHPKFLIYLAGSLTAVVAVYKVYGLFGCKPRVRGNKYYSTEETDCVTVKTYIEKPYDENSKVYSTVKRQNEEWCVAPKVGKQLRNIIKDAFPSEGCPITEGLQAGVSDGYEPTGEDKVENIWYKNDFVLTPFSLTPFTTSSKSMSRSDFEKLVSRSIVYFDIEGGARSCAFCLRGQLYVTTAHSIPHLENGKALSVTLLFGLRDQGVTGNSTVIVDASCVRRIKSVDLVVIRFPIVNKKGLWDYLPMDHIEVKHNGFYIGREETGGIDIINVDNIHNQIRQVYEHEKVPYDYIANFGLSDKETYSGFCGSPLFINTHFGFALVGVHVRGGSNGSVNEVISVHVNRKILNEAFNSFDLQFDEGSVMLSAPSAPRVITNLHKKSSMRYLCDGTATVVGSYEGFRPRYKSLVETTPMSEFLQYKTPFGAPELSGWEPWHNAAKELTKPLSNFLPSVVTVVRDSFLSDILSGLDEDQLDTLHPYDMFTTINGASSVKYVDKINRNTSAGLPWRKLKRNFMTAMVDAPEDMPDSVSVDAEILDRVKMMQDEYLNFRTVHPVTCGSLKDEARKKGKAARLFNGAPFDFVILVRKYFLSSVRLIQNNTNLFEAAPGVVAQGTQWDDMYYHITKFGTDRIIAGDYAAFDKQMISEFIRAAFDILIVLCGKSGNFSPEDLTIMKGISYDIAYPMIDLNGDLLRLWCSNPSGHPLTVIINCLVNSMYLRYVYLFLNPKKECTSFKQNVSLMCYGDDNIMSVSKRINWFNHTTIMNELATMGIRYTMADKTEASRPFIDMKEATFLKRRWRFDPVVKRFVAPLEIESIQKSLSVWVRSKSVSREVQGMDIITCAVYEYWFHGQRKFAEESRRLKELVKLLKWEKWLTETTFPSWEELHDRYKKISRDHDTDLPVPDLSYLSLQSKPSHKKKNMERIKKRNVLRYSIIPKDESDVLLEVPLGGLKRPQYIEFSTQTPSPYSTFEMLIWNEEDYLKEESDLTEWETIMFDVQDQTKSLSN